MAGTGSRDDSEGAMPRVVSTPDVLGGDPRIEGHRIGVHDIHQRHTGLGDTPEEIATSYDISVSEVHAALAYAFSNTAEMRAIEERNQELSEQDTPDRVVPAETF
jgi:uncharacterized protein (DUF433 family)